MRAWSRTFAALAFCLITTRGGEVWTLERAVDYAVKHNPDARIAQHRIAAARAGLAQANSSFWPKLQLQSSYLRTDNPMVAFGSILNQRSFSPTLDFNNVPETDNLNVRGLVTAPLYMGGRNARERDAARSTSRAAEYDEASVRNSLEFEVVRSFYTISKAGLFTRSVESALNSHATNLLIAQRRLEAGTLLKADVLDFEVRLAATQEELVGARNAKSIAERGLRNLLGIETADEFVLSDQTPTLVAPNGAGAERPELHAVWQREEAAAAKVRGAKSGYKPRLSAFGNVDYDYGPVTHGDGGSYAAGVVAQWDLWDGFSTRSKIAEAETNLESLREEERKLRLNIDLEIEQARLNLAAARERLAATGKSVSQADESVRLTRDRFEQGAALPTQVIDAENALLAARIRRADAEADENIAIAALRKALALPQIEPASARK